MTLTDGRGELYQWDTGRTLTVDDATVTQVHFQNRAYGRTIDVDVNNSVAIIPDEILQKPGDLRVYAFSGTAESGFTKVERVFNVVRRNKPNDYMYTPTEQKSLEGLQKQIGDLSELNTDAKTDLVAAINETATAGKTLGLTGATVGQVPAVKAVDGNGAPTEWEAVEFPEQVQSDWEQTDETAADYVKNRPFGLVAYDGILFAHGSNGWRLERVPDASAFYGIQGTRQAEIRGTGIVIPGSANISASDYDGSVNIEYTSTSGHTIINISGEYGVIDNINVQSSEGIGGWGTYELHIDGLYYEEYIKLSADSVEGTLPSASAADCALISTGSGNNWSVTKISTDFPLASATGRGAVKVGDGLSISSDGKLSVDMSGLDTKSLGLTGATVGQTVKIKAVDENGVPTEWEASDATPLKLVGEYTLSENALRFDVENLDISANAISIILGGITSSTGAALTVYLNGVKLAKYGGSMGNDTKIWLWKQDGTWYLKALMSNGGIHNGNFATGSVVSPITSIGITNQYAENNSNEDITQGNYFNSGTKMRIYEGVMPNVGY